MWRVNHPLSARNGITVICLQGIFLQSFVNEDLIRKSKIELLLPKVKICSCLLGNEVMNSIIISSDVHYEETSPCVKDMFEINFVLSLIEHQEFHFLRLYVVSFLSKNPCF